MYKYQLCIVFFLFLLFGCSSPQQSVQPQATGRLYVSANGRFLTTANGDPFFWLGDTGWLLFTKLTREEAAMYLENRKQKGFNVIQVMILHSTGSVNVYGDSALMGNDVASPKITAGNSFADSTQYDYWDNVDYVVDMAAEKGLYMAMVPVWGSAVKVGGVNTQQAKAYASFLAARYRHKPNIVWLNGGDINGSDSLNVWKAIGETLNAADTAHLITFHPRGRKQSSAWFHNEPWLDFNMIQSGHRSYAQDTSKGDLHYGEDNWRYVSADYQLAPARPTIDGEPSYEGIPYGLHDTTQPYWNADEIRRYAYWSVFAGGFGFTYGDNAVMQFHRSGRGAFGPRQSWDTAINNPGATQMVHLKKLMLSRPFFERVPGENLLVKQGEKYNYLAAARGQSYAFIYTWNGIDIPVKLGVLKGNRVKASWYNPGDGSSKPIGEFENKGEHIFAPPGDVKNGNDWVLVLDAE